MKNSITRVLVGISLIVLSVLVMSDLSSGAGDEKREKLLRHVVLFKFKPTASAAQIEEVTDAFSALPGKIDAIHGFEWGTDVSVENKSEGFTHCFVVTFRTKENRDEYLPHPGHKEFVKLVGPRLEKVLVVDYWTQ